MKYYRHPVTQDVFAFDEDVDQQAIPGNLVPMGPAEVVMHKESVAAPVAPGVVSTFQAKAALLEAGKLAQVEAYINAAGTDPVVKLAWDTVQVFRRESLMVMAVAIELNLTSAQLDALFTRAAQIVV